MEFFIKNKNGFYFLIDGKIYKLSEEFTYNDLKLDYDKIEFITDNINDLINLKIVSDGINRDICLKEILNKT